ncbi:AAA family ATPase [Mariprofundus sp. KV]|uniref:AAA family ATPase n=1 Tax=Mariprofundus sp. KV TaxID=2608715 RepID=UPI0015A48F9F|nr:AAA family ATPase [Mariprofundus sp. KV]NWF36667.1 ATP-binding protein [Mariprofundus sp. KV]
MSKKRDDRTHDEKLTALREEFGRTKECARSSGLINDCSINAICKAAGVERLLVLGHRELKKTPEITAAYRKVGDDIKEFRAGFSQKKEISEDKVRIKQLEDELDAVKLSVGPMIKEKAYLELLSEECPKKLEREKNRVTELQARLIHLENESMSTPKPSKVANNLNIVRTIISPDKFRNVEGHYKFGNERYEEEAWKKSYSKLELALSRKLAMRLYILVGLPCAGKSTWAEESVLAGDRHPVIFDATNLERFERAKLVHSLQRFGDLPKACVYFDTDMETIRGRNRDNRSSDRQLTDDVLSMKLQQLEKPDPYDETWIDQLIIVRQP